jgi:hypothetical protein
VRLEKALDMAAKSRRGLKPAAGGASPIQGTWKNQYGSVALLVVNLNVVTGTYTSQVSSGGPPITGAVTGFAIEDTVAFSVLWPGTGSITSWVGQVVDEGGVPTLRTLWHLVVDIPDANEPKSLWQTIYSGADTFRQ